MSEQVDLSTIPISPDGANGPSLASDGPSNSQETVTVFHDKENFNVKHPLANQWTLWFTKPPSGKVGDVSAHDVFSIVLTDFEIQGDNWNELLKEVITFESVEEFWGIYVCHIFSVSDCILR